MVDQDPLTYGSPLQAALADGVVLPASADISKCDKRFRFYAQRCLLQHFTNVFDWDWASSQLLCALLCVLLMDCVICTPWGQKYKRHSRLALSGAYMIQTMEIWLSTVSILRASLSCKAATSMWGWSATIFCHSPRGSLGSGLRDSLLKLNGMSRTC